MTKIILYLILGSGQKIFSSGGIRQTAKVMALLLALCALQVSGQHAKDHIAGSWQGVLNVGTELRLVFNISVNEDLSLKATMDSPDQGAMGIPLGEVSLNEDSIRIEAPIVNGYYIGAIVSESTI